MRPRVTFPMNRYLLELSAITTIAAVTVGGGIACAQEEPPSPEPGPAAEAPLSWVDPPAERGLWYRRSLLLADGIALAVAIPVVVGGFSSAPEDRVSASLTPLLSFAPLTLTGPIVHLARGNGWRALASLGMRALFFTVGATVGASLRATCDELWGACGSTVYSATIGATMVGPALLDASLFTEGERSASGRRAGPPVTPMLHVGERGARFGLGASF